MLNARLLHTDPSAILKDPEQLAALTPQERETVQAAILQRFNDRRDAKRARKETRVP